jgi:hypothetical protein
MTRGKRDSSRTPTGPSPMTNSRAAAAMQRGCERKNFSQGALTRLDEMREVRFQCAHGDDS